MELPGKQIDSRGGNGDRWRARSGTARDVAGNSSLKKSFLDEDAPIRVLMAKSSEGVERDLVPLIQHQADLKVLIGPDSHTGEIDRSTQ